MPQGNNKGKKPTLPGIKKKTKKMKLPQKSCRVPLRKNKQGEANRLKQIITKNVNKCMEEQIRSIANNSQKIHLSKKKDKGEPSFDPNKMPPMESS